MYNTYTSKYNNVGLVCLNCCLVSMRFGFIEVAAWRISIAFLFRFFGFSPCFPLTNSEFMTIHIL